MSKKKSEFIAINRVPDDYSFNVFGNGVDREIPKPDLFAQIKDESFSPFIYPTIELLQNADLEADEDNPTWVRCKETEYRLYQITNLAPGVDDIALDNGNTATYQLEYRDVGFVIGPDVSVAGSLAIFTDTGGAQLDDLLVPTNAGKAFMQAADGASVSFPRKNADNTVSMLGASTYFDAIKQVSAVGYSGTIETASNASTLAQVATDEAVTPANLAALKASNAETMAGTDDTKYITSENLQAKIDDELSDKPTVIENFSALASTPVVVGRTYYLKEYHAGTGKGGGELEAYASTDTPNNGTIFASGTTGVRLKRLGADSAGKTSWFGCRLDGTTDDTVAMQAAIDYCLPQPASIPAKKLIVDGRSKINSVLYIDRAVDATVNLFVIEGEGKSSGFLTSTGFTLFDSRAAYGPAAGLYTKSPVTEFTVFKNIVFENTIASASAYIFNEKYLRLAFEECRFRGFRGGMGTDFWQSIKFYRCHFRGNNGTFLENLDGYDIRVVDCEFESAGLGFKFTGVLRGSSIESGLCQNTTVPLAEIATGNGVTVEAMYFENNSGTNYVKFGSGTSDGVNVQNNTFLLSSSQESDVNYYPVDFGSAKHGSLVGNYSSGNLADESNTAQLAISHSGNAVPVNRLVVKSQPIITPNAAGTQVTATKIRTKCVICQGGALNSSVILPQITASQEVDVIIVANQGGSTIQVYPFSGERILGLAYNAATTIASGASKHFINSQSNDYWVEY